MSLASLLKSYTTALQYRLHNAYMHEKLSRYGVLFTGRLLDVGAGDAPYRRYFPRVAHYVTTNTRRHYGTHTGVVEAATDHWIEDAASLPLGDASMDGMVCFQVMSVVDDPSTCIAEFSRVLKPGGKFCITTDYIYPSWSKEDKGRYAAATWSTWCTAAGLNVEKVESFGSYRSTLYSIYTRYVRDIPALFRQEKNTFKKLVYLYALAMAMLSMPFQSLRGWIIFQLEKHQVQNPGASFNLLIFGEKPADKAS